MDEYDSRKNILLICYELSEIIHNIKDFSAEELDIGAIKNELSIIQEQLSFLENGNNVNLNPDEIDRLYDVSFKKKKSK